LHLEPLLASGSLGGSRAVQGAGVIGGALGTHQVAGVSGALAGVEYVSYGGMQLPFYREHHLRTLAPAQLREHANLLYRTLGHHTIGEAVPINDHELHSWIMRLHGLHLEPLLASGSLGGSRAVQGAGVIGGALGTHQVAGVSGALAGVEYVSYGGMQLPFYREHHLRTLAPAQLREHANLLYRTLGHHTIGEAVPINDHELHSWIMRLHGLHLEHLLASGSLGGSNARVLGTAFADALGIEF